MKIISSVTLTQVIKFFIDEIDGIGMHDGFPRNQGTPDSLRNFSKWEFCELTEEEFIHLVIPDGTNTLIKDKELNTTGGNSRVTILRYLNNLKKGKSIPPLIVRDRLGAGPKDSSFGRC